MCEQVIFIVFTNISASSSGLFRCKATPRGRHKHCNRTAEVYRAALPVSSGALAYAQKANYRKYVDSLIGNGNVICIYSVAAFYKDS